MNLKDELHDVKALGGVRQYLRTAIEIRRSNREWRQAQEQRDEGFEPDTTERASLRDRWQEHRDLMVERRAERTERRLVKTSTYDALMENVGPVVDGDTQTVHEEVLADTAAVERRRWFERVSWILTVIGVLGIGWAAGWYAQPQFKPEPWVCDVKVVPDAPLVEPTIMRCVGGEKPE